MRWKQERGLSRNDMGMPGLYGVLLACEKELATPSVRNEAVTVGCSMWSLRSLPQLGSPMGRVRGNYVPVHK